MAQRFGGRFSPGATGQSGAPPGNQSGNQPLARARPARSGGRVNMLFVLPFVFAALAFTQRPVGLALDLGAFGLLILAAWLTREGERAHEAWEARTTARRPAIPRKIFASVLMAAGVGMGAFVPGTDVLGPALLALLAGGLHLASFGPDPLRDKGMAGVDRAQTERVARAIADAETHINAMREAITRTGDRDLLERTNRFAATARGMFRRVEEDPRDLTSARRYLSVYLLGARDAARRYADLAGTRSGNDAGARTEFVALLDDLDTRFAQRTEVLMSNDRTELEIEIEVLRERLAQDAPRTS